MHTSADSSPDRQDIARFDSRKKKDPDVSSSQLEPCVQARNVHDTISARPLWWTLLTKCGGNCVWLNPHIPPLFLWSITDSLPPPSPSPTLARLSAGSLQGGSWLSVQLSWTLTFGLSRPKRPPQAIVLASAPRSLWRVVVRHQHRHDLGILVSQRMMRRSAPGCRAPTCSAWDKQVACAHVAAALGNNCVLHAQLVQVHTPLP